MATKINDADVNELASAIAKALKTGGIGGTKGPTGGSSGASIDAAGKSVNLFELAVEGAGKGVDAMKSAYDKVSKELESGMGTWRDFTKSGISFNNDIIGMQAASAGARVGLGEFAQTVKENQVNLAGFGGGVGEGAKAFAALSKKMFDAGEATDSLRQLGYTNKELNDVLALQAGMIGSSMRKGAEKDEIAIKAAQDLAYEMDTMAKLTGKSREAQMESQKKLAADAAFNAKLDQATRNMDEKQAAEYRSKIMAEYTKAEAIGLGQSFKETFTYGQVMSKQAATEQTIAGRAGVEATRAAQSAAAGNFEEASRRMSNAQDEAIKNNKDANFQQLTIYGQFAGAAGEAAQKQYMTNKAMTDTIKALEKEPEHRGKSEAELRKIAIERIENEQKNAAGSTKAILNVEQRMNDLSSVMMNSVVKPLNEKVNPELNKFADAVLGARSALIKGAPEKGVARAAEDEIEAGRQQRVQGTDRPKGILQGVGYGTDVVGDVAAAGLGAANKGAAKVGEAVQKRQGGSLEMGGKLFENWGSGTLVELHGLEGVVRPEDMKKILSSSMGGIGEAMKGAQQTSMKMPEIKMPEIKMPDMTSTGATQPNINNPLAGLNISDLSKNISTSVSTVVGGATKSIQLSQTDLAELTKPFTDSFTNFSSKLKTVAKDSEETITSDLFDDFGDNFDEVMVQMATDISDALPLDVTRELAQAKIDQARQDHDDAKAEVTKLLNDETASDEEINSAYDRYKEKYDTLNQVVNDSIGELSSGFDDFSSGWEDSVDKISNDISEALPVDDFAGLEEAIQEQKRMSANTSGQDIYSEDGTVAQGMKINPETGETYYTDDTTTSTTSVPYDEMAGVDEAVAQQSAMNELINTTSPTVGQEPGRGKIDINSFTLSKSGMPIAKPKSTSAAAPAKPAEKQASPGKAINPETGEEYTPVGDAPAAGGSSKGGQSAASSDAGGGKATLDDVVKALTALNSKVSQLTSTSEQGFAAVARSNKSMSNNLYERAKA
jgi:hypothetical protein